LSPQTYILSYPGIAFKFPVPNNTPLSPSDKTLLNIFHKNEPPCLATSLVIFPGTSWAEARTALSQYKPRTTSKKNKRQEQRDIETDDSDVLEFAEIFPNDKILLTFQSGNTVALIYAAFTVQDAVTLLGPPSEVYTKSDTRLNIHNGHTRHDEIDTGPLSEGNPYYECPLTWCAAADYFYNYFSCGLSLLFSPSKNHTLQKVLLHANLPHSHAFHRFNRIQWTLNVTSASRNKKESHNELLSSEMNFDEIKSCLERASGPSGKPMIVNRGGQGSPSSSIELVSDDILTATPFGCTGKTSLSTFLTA
jgi:hypothetical protein